MLPRRGGAAGGWPIRLQTAKKLRLEKKRRRTAAAEEEEVTATFETCSLQRC